MFAESFAKLICSNLPPEAFVRRALRLLEGEFRERALLAVGAWEESSVPSTEWVAAVPELFLAIGAIQHPAWGAWNGLLTSFRKARRILLERGTAGVRERFEKSAQLTRLLDSLDLPIQSTMLGELQPLIRFTHCSLPKKARIADVLALPIALRNRIVHDEPEDGDWWAQAGQSLRPLLVMHAQSLLCPPSDATPFPAPWLVAEGGQIWSFNGTERDFTPIYVSRQGKNAP